MVLWGKLWFLNGAHLVLKEWHAEMTVNDVNFDTSTFIIQIHGLPLELIHDGTSAKIGDGLGRVDKASFRRIAHRYLKFKLDLQVGNPIPAGSSTAKPMVLKLGFNLSMIGWATFVTNAE